MSKKEEKKSFEMMLEELEILVKKMEQGGLSLEEMLKAYEEGTKLQKELQKILDETKGKLTVLQEEEGSLQEHPLEGME